MTAHHLRFASPCKTTFAELLALQALARNLPPMIPRGGRSAGASAGSRRSARGLEFAEVRPYLPGDDVRSIDWNVTARRGSLHTKCFMEESDRPVLLLVDLGDAMHFATRGCYKSAHAERLAALVAWRAMLRRDRVGGIVHGAAGAIETEPRGGRGGLMRLLAALARGGVQPGARRSDIVESVVRLNRMLGSGGELCVLSDASGMDDRLVAALHALPNGVHVRAVQVADPIEYRLPAGFGRYLLGGRRGPRRWLITGDAERERAHRRRFLEAFRERVATLDAVGHRCVLVATDEPLDHAARRVLAGSPSGEALVA